MKVFSKESVPIWALVISTCSVAISVKSFYREPLRDSDKMTSEIIRQGYSDFLALSNQRTRNPQQSHLFELPGTYWSASAQVKQAIRNRIRAPGERERLLLEERAIADLIFTMFEQAYFQSQLAENMGDKNRSDFLSLELNYFSQRLLRNPRLLWYWSDAGGKLHAQYEQDTQEFYEREVKPKEFKADTDGPFGKNKKLGRGWIDINGKP